MDIREVEVPEYERPKIVDYGSLEELTNSGHINNSDVPAGTPNTANPVLS